MYYFEDETLTENERYIKKSAALSNSRLFNKWFWPDFSLYPEIEKLTEQLIKEIKTVSKYKPWRLERRLKRSMTVLLIDLYKNNLEDPIQYLAFSRTYEDYILKRIPGTKKAERLKSEQTGNYYNPVAISRKIIDLVDYLIELGYIENHKGIRGYPGKKGKVSRIKSTPLLLDLFRKYSIDENSISTKPATENVIVFRDEDKNNLEYQENPEIIEVKGLVSRYNDMLENTYIDLNLSGNPLENIHPKKLPVRVNLKNKYYRRVFNNIKTEEGKIVNAGGRYYSHFCQQIPTLLRQRIVMGDPPEETEEIDFGFLHPTILASFNNVSLDSDPYTIEGYPPNFRPLFKLILLVLINVDSKEKALQAVEREVREEDGYKDFRTLNLLTIINKFEKTHQKIANHFYTGAGLSCQNIEAAISSSIINVFTNRNKLLLNIHDSFLCQKKDSDLLFQTMISCFKGVLQKKGLMIVEPKLKIIQKESNNINLEDDPELNLRYLRWKEYDKTIQYKKVLINKKK